MRARVLLAVALVAAILAAVPTVGSAAPSRSTRRIPLSGTEMAEAAGLPRQVGPAKAAKIAAAQQTTESQCMDSTDTLVLSLTSFEIDPPQSQVVVFHRETPADAPGRARIWVAWDFRQNAYDPVDPITCDQVAFLQERADAIIDRDVEYFGDYEARTNGGKSIDILTYNVVDDAFYNPDATQYVAGFYSSQAEEQFDRNIFFLDSDPWENGLGDDALDRNLVEGIFAHELVHLIFADHDADEPEWVQEGLADVGIYVNGYADAPILTGGVVYYIAFHRDPLTTWGSLLEDYGGAFLFQLYLLENFGSQRPDGTFDPSWTRAMTDQPLDGIAGVEAATGEDMATLFDAWMLANLEDDPSRTAAGGYPMGYETFDTNPVVDDFLGAWTIRDAIKSIYGADANGNLPISRYFGGATSGSVEFPQGAAGPYAAFYKSYGGQEPAMSIRFRGDERSGVAPPEGVREVFSGGGNLLTDRTLSLEAPVGGTLTFKTWFDIEDDWDFGFVEASTDGGSTWTQVPGSITRTSTNPNGSTAWANALDGATSTDAAITGTSGGWVDASFELPAASGVSVRFNYYTDEAVNGKGWFIDDLHVDGVAEGFEAGSAGWDLGGWTVTTGLFDNDWVVAYVNPKPGGKEIGYLQGEHLGDGYERMQTLLDTSRLGSRRVVVAFANRPRIDDAFDAGYLILVRKKG